MYKLTKNHFIGYSLMLVGITICIFNYFTNCKSEVDFGYIPLYVFSGIASALGLTFVFNEKIDRKVEDVETNNT